MELASLFERLSVGDEEDRAVALDVAEEMGWASVLIVHPHCLVQHWMLMSRQYLFGSHVGSSGDAYFGRRIRSFARGSRMDLSRYCSVVESGTSRRWSAAVTRRKLWCQYSVSSRGE